MARKLPEIHIDIDSHNANPAKRKGTSKPRRVSQITKKPPTKRLVARRKANSEPGYFPNPINNDWEVAFNEAFKRLKSRVNDVTRQAYVSYCEGLIVAAMLLGYLDSGRYNELRRQVAEAVNLRVRVV